MPVHLVTCVTNFNGIGPGHSCLEINGMIHSFEAVKGAWGNSGQSGWIQIGAAKYYADNAHRPVIKQLLNGRVSEGKVLGYILNSAAADDDYLSSGVCSSQAASAIEAGFQGSFNTMGIDTPYDIYVMANNKGIVGTESMAWPGKNKILLEHRLRIEAVLAYMKLRHYTGV